ncbi:hypothetical protein OE88DRAFT_1403886 [Heliocybe sulcata]|uniref:Uncharacterized protein n=1 Tax=Heliocybe sulcata TaxID=5364 RepID=A0A5C3N585_9AGAM|nr:hypothetical protein OE88DRAFT_1403886 [Heliocybe sulcata]
MPPLRCTSACVAVCDRGASSPLSTALLHEWLLLVLLLMQTSVLQRRNPDQWAGDSLRHPASTHHLPHPCNPRLRFHHLPNRRIVRRTVLFAGGLTRRPAAVVGACAGTEAVVREGGVVNLLSSASSSSSSSLMGISTTAWTRRMSCIRRGGAAERDGARRDDPATGVACVVRALGVAWGTAFCLPFADSIGGGAGGCFAVRFVTFAAVWVFAVVSSADWCASVL